MSSEVQLSALRQPHRNPQTTVPLFADYARMGGARPTHRVHTCCARYLRKWKEIFCAGGCKSMTFSLLYGAFVLGDVMAISGTILGQQTGNEKMVKQYGLCAAGLTAVVLYPPIAIALTFSE